MATLPTFVAGQILTAADLNAAFAATRTDGPWTAWTPSWTNFTIGNAYQACTYFRSGNFVALHLYIAMGTTSVMGTSPTFTLPVAANSNNYGGGLVSAYRDVSAAADYDGFIRLAGTGSAWLMLTNKAGANDGRAHVTAALPFTWAVNDIISGYLLYEAA